MREKEQKKREKKLKKAKEKRKKRSKKREKTIPRNIIVQQCCCYHCISYTTCTHTHEQNK